MSLLKDVAVQLYSVRDVTEGDFKGVLEKLGKNGMGYSGVEFAGFGGLSISDMRAALDENGLKPISSHTGVELLLDEKKLDDEIAYQKALGIEYIICPYAELETKADALALAKKLTPVAEKIMAAGLKFGYHNHAHELVKDDGEYLLDILFDNLPEGSVMELDVFWTEYAGIDTLAYMEKNKSRLALLHLKQINNDKKNVDFDKGLIDFAGLIKKAQSLGVKHFIVEQEEYELSSMVSVENAINHLSALR